MSTSTNTLFRFVTMRGPEKFKDGSRFLYHPDPETLGYFKTLLTSPATGRTLQRQNQLTLASTFTPLTDDEGIAGIVGYDLIMYTRWMIKNLDTISKTPGYVTSYPEYGIVLNEREYTEANIVDLWDNLFYQIITGEDPQMRDFLMYLLIAIRVVQSDGTPDQDKYVFSKVVIPKNFFGLDSVPDPAEEEEDEEGRTGLPGLATGTVYARLNEKIGVVKAKAKIGDIANAVKEIEQAKKTWERANRTSYEAQRQIHDAELEGAMKTAIPIIDEETGKPYYDGLDLPAFSFAPSDQLTSGVAATLSDQSRQILDELNLTYPASFDAVLEDLAASLRQETDTVFTGSNPVRPVMTIGDVLIPVDEELPPSAPVHSYSIQLEQIRGFKYKVYLAIHTGYNNPAALDARYSSSFEGVSEPVQLSAFNSEALGSTLVLELYPDGLTVPDGVLAFSIDGEVTLSNGLRIIFSTVLQLEGGATGVMNVDESNAAGPGNVSVYVPTGFGIKQLGIADYRKVEQTVCCYVPGEVSHIENVMAREYKEKSTRRFRSSEETTTTETEKEKEQLTDTTSTSRYDMQQEVASIINKDSSTQTNTNFSASYGPTASISMAAGYAQNNSQQQSNSQAISYAKDVTERALERVVQRVREERISKVVEEYEEQNKHGFDNREGDSHVSGVYRWVDKIFKNSIRNYGKRLMYEFMIPQPAVFHLEALKNIPGANPGVILTRPVDPRSEEAGVNRIATFNEVTEFNYKYWAAAYNAEVEPCVEKLKTIGKSFSGAKFGDHELTDGSADLQIPEGYVAKRANVKLYAKYDGDTKQMHSFGVNVGNISHWYDEQRYSIRKDDNVYLELDNYKGQLPLSYFCENYHTFNIAVTVRLEATEELINKWKQETFDAILKAYNQKRLEYEDALAANSQSAKVNPGFFRQIENTVLRKNCITYLVGHNNLGKELYSGEGVINKKPLDNVDLDQYSSLVKFIEQAFEWNEISYTLYPFYWAGKNNWQSLYQQEVDDALFRSFLQSGMARVIATVRPGFEEAVMHYMATGQVWNGSQPPVIGDELYLSVIEELRNPEYEIEESWESRVPTSLTVIQAGGIALDVDGLPCACGDDEETGISQSESKLGVAGDPPVDQ